MHKLLLWSSTLPAFGFTVSSIALLLTAHTRVVQRLTFLSVIKLFASVSHVLHEKALPFFLSLISTSNICKKSDFSPYLLFEQLTAGCSVSFLFFLGHPTTSNSISSYTVYTSLTNCSFSSFKSLPVTHSFQEACAVLRTVQCHLMDCSRACDIALQF